MKDKGDERKPISKKRDLVRTIILGNNFYEADTTIWSYIFHTLSKNLDDTVPSY